MMLQNCDDRTFTYNSSDIQFCDENVFYSSLNKYIFLISITLVARFVTTWTIFHIE